MYWLPLFNTVCTVFTPSKSVLAENCVCLCKHLYRCYSDRLKILILYGLKFRRTKVPSLEKWRNGPLFWPCPPPLPNFRDSSKTNSAIDVKLGRSSHTTIWHRPWICFWNPSEIFEIRSILWRHYTPLLVENWPNFAGLWKTQFLMKIQLENTKRRKMRSSTRWLSRFFKILGFWVLKFQKIVIRYLRCLRYSRHALAHGYNITF